MPILSIFSKSILPTYGGFRVDGHIIITMLSNKIKRREVAARPGRRPYTNPLTGQDVFEQVQLPVSLQEPA